jgi:very-short-patch-repair endonuclease
MWSRLRMNQLGFKFRRQHSIGRYIVDFYCPEKKLAIELDGSQHLDDEKYDNKRTDYLNALGIAVLRFGDNEVNTNMEGVLLKIITTLDPSLPHLNPPLRKGRR